MRYATGPLPFDLERWWVAWQQQGFTFYVAQEKIEPEVVENMRTWQHCGCSVDQSVFLPACDQAGTERLTQGGINFCGWLGAGNQFFYQSYCEFRRIYAKRIVRCCKVERPVLS
jgi:hypothetical protein